METMTSFYFYDLETSGISAKDARVMQFAGQRTDMDLKPIGEPHNIIIRLSDDVLPEPDAVMITGITPQKSIEDGITEAEFLKIFHEQVATKDTIFVGFNTVRFDDEFMRYMQYRNFYDPYEWQWKEGRSRWDLLDVARMTRALRPEGITWPFDSNGKPTNRLELLTSVNNLSHENAHDALSDVYATIAVAQMIKDKQPKLFAFLLEMRDKKQAQALVQNDEMFVYTSGKYSSEHEKTTIATKLSDAPEGAALVYDLSVDPAPFMKMSEAEIIKAWTARYNDPSPKLPVKTIKFNRCPAIAPLSVLDSQSQERLKLDVAAATDYIKVLKKTDFARTCLAALEKMNNARNQKQSGLLADLNDVDGRLYDGFIPGTDKTLMSRVRAAEPSQLAEISAAEFNDDRLQGLLPLYKARNFYSTLTTEERLEWDRFRATKLTGGGDSSRLARYMKRLAELAVTVKDPQKHYLLQELQLYAEAIIPDPDVLN